MKLNNDEVLHVANLARLNIQAEEVGKYQEQLNAIMSEIDKITSVSVDSDILIAPTSNKNVYKEDIEGPMLTKKEIFKNTNNISDDYVVVPRVIND